MATGIQLHIRFPQDGDCHSVPYSVVDSYIKGVRNLTGLVALAICRRDAVGGVNSLVDAQRLYELMVSSPEQGSVVLPLGLQDLLTDVRVSASSVLSALFIVLSAISNGQDRGLELLNQLTDNERATFVAEIGKLSPDDSSRTVSLDFKDGSVVFSSAMTLAATARLKNFEIAPDGEIRTLIGEFIAVDVSERVISVRSLETGKIVKCRYFPEAFDGSVMTPQNRIQLVGKYIEDADGAIVSMSDVSSVAGVDLTPLKVPFRGHELNFRVELDQDSGQYYWAVDHSLGIEVFAETRSRLITEVIGMLESNWEQLALRDDKELDESALLVKRALLALV